MTAADNPSASVSPLAAGAAALRRFWRPFILIQAAAALLAIAYWMSATFRAACAVAAAWKSSGGLPFAAATAPWPAVRSPSWPGWPPIGARHDCRGRAGEILFNTAFFAFNGVVIDLLYRGEALLFGGDPHPLTVVEKVAFDQFVFNPVWGVLIVLLFLWRQRRFSLAATLPVLRRGFYRARVLPLLIPSWLFWIPMVSIIYALPVPLQFLLFVPALGAWSLIMVFIADR